MSLESFVGLQEKCRCWKYVSFEVLYWSKTSCIVSGSILMFIPSEYIKQMIWESFSISIVYFFIWVICTYKSYYTVWLVSLWPYVSLSYAVLTIFIVDFLSAFIFGFIKALGIYPWISLEKVIINLWFHIFIFIWYPGYFLPYIYIYRFFPSISASADSITRKCYPSSLGNEFFKCKKRRKYLQHWTQTNFLGIVQSLTIW